MPKEKTNAKYWKEQEARILVDNAVKGPRIQKKAKLQGADDSSDDEPVAKKPKLRSNKRVSQNQLLRQGTNSLLSRYPRRIYHLNHYQVVPITQATAPPTAAIVNAINDADKITAEMTVTHQATITPPSEPVSITKPSNATDNYKSNTTSILQSSAAGAGSEPLVDGYDEVLVDGDDKEHTLPANPTEPGSKQVKHFVHDDLNFMFVTTFCLFTNHISRDGAASSKSKDVFLDLPKTVELCLRVDEKGGLWVW
jgi:hypothetical protein